MYAIAMTMFVPAAFPITNGIVADKCSPTSQELTQIYENWNNLEWYHLNFLSIPSLSQRGEMYRAFELD